MTDDEFSVTLNIGTHETPRWELATRQKIDDLFSGGAVTVSLEHGGMWEKHDGVWHQVFQYLVPSFDLPGQFTGFKTFARAYGVNQ